MAANPFLFTDDDYTSPHSATSNPFLINDDFQAETDNPFLSQSNNTATNPFAFDPEELETTDTQVLTSTNEHNLFGVNECNAIPQKPTDLDLKYTNTVDGSLTNDAKGPKDTSAPPPRPPPSKETQDLLMSVMGAMDATSSHLLDRIPPTRTPSPVSMRDLHSPSPTPEPNFGDLLDVSDSKSANKEPEGVINDLLSLSQCDINQNPPLTETAKSVKEKPMRPSPPSRPPRPQPPQKPPPPSFAQTSPPQQSQLPPKPPPPSVAKSKSPADEMMDMFGSEEVAPTVPKAKATKDDILNLYNKPKTEPIVKDLLCDDALEPVEEKTQIDTDITMEDTFENVSKVAEPVVTEIIEQSIERVAETVTVEPTQNVQDAFLSPELQNDFQMDTSESQSKESLSSVTFNPFASNEDTVIQKSPTKSSLDNNAFQDQPIVLDNAPFQQQTQAPPPQQQVTITKTQFTTADSFDAFAEKFESAKDGEVKNELNAFTNGNDDAWGSNTGIGGFDGSGGFEEGDSSFDAFLAMQEPPAVPKSTPNKFSRGGSESDEDKDFSVFIR